MKGKLVFGAALVVALTAIAGTYAWASAGAAATQTINACLGDGGQLRLVAIAGDCKKAETPLSWNTVGPAGPPGAQGAAGRDGLTGPQGPPGASSSTPPDPNAVAATMTITSTGFGTGAIAVTGYSHEIVSPRDPSSGLASGKRMHKPLTITKQLDASSPLLLKAAVDNRALSSILIGLLRNGQQVATVKLTNALISDYTANGDTEHWSFTYQKITWTWLDGNVTAEDDWVATS
jgi:type VI secretion system secreted protein Hcp